MAETFGDYAGQSWGDYAGETWDGSSVAPWGDTDVALLGFPLMLGPFPWPYGIWSDNDALTMLGLYPLYVASLLRNEQVGGISQVFDNRFFQIGGVGEVYVG